MNLVSPLRGNDGNVAASVTHIRAKPPFMGLPLRNLLFRMSSKVEKRARVDTALYVLQSQKDMDLDRYGPKSEQSTDSNANCPRDNGKSPDETTLATREAPRDCCMSSQSSQTSPTSRQDPQPSSKPTSLSFQSEADSQNYCSENNSSDRISFNLPSYESSLHLDYEVAVGSSHPDVENPSQGGRIADIETSAEENCREKGQNLQLRPLHNPEEMVQALSIEATSNSPSKSNASADLRRRVAFMPFEPNLGTENLSSSSSKLSRNEAKKHISVPETPLSRSANDVVSETSFERSQSHRAPSLFHRYHDVVKWQEKHLRSEKTRNDSDEHGTSSPPAKHSPQGSPVGPSDTLQKTASIVSLHSRDDPIQRPANSPAPNTFHRIADPIRTPSNDAPDLAENNPETSIISKSPQTEIVPLHIDYPLGFRPCTMIENNDSAGHRTSVDQAEPECSPLSPLWAEGDGGSPSPVCDSPDDFRHFPKCNRNDHNIKNDRSTAGSRQPKRLVTFPTLPPISPSPLSDFRYASKPRLSIQDSILSGRGRAWKGRDGAKGPFPKEAPRISSMNRTGTGGICALMLIIF